MIRAVEWAVLVAVTSGVLLAVTQTPGDQPGTGTAACVCLTPPPVGPTWKATP